MRRKPRNDDIRPGNWGKNICNWKTQFPVDELVKGYEGKSRGWDYGVKIRGGCLNWDLDL